MAAPSPDSFDYFRRGEPTPVLHKSATETTFDYFRRGEPALDAWISATPASSTKRSFAVVIG